MVFFEIGHVFIIIYSIDFRGKASSKVFSEFHQKRFLWHPHRRGRSPEWLCQWFYLDFSSIYFFDSITILFFKEYRANTIQNHAASARAPLSVILNGVRNTEKPKN